MPRKEEAKRRRQVLASQQALDQATANAPEHVKRRLGQPSRLGNNLATKGQHNSGWAKFDEYGQDIQKQTDPDGQGANMERQETAEAEALEVRARHRSIWRKRGSAKKIAHLEGLSVETIRRYMRKL